MDLLTISDADRIQIYSVINSVGPFYLGFPMFDDTGEDLDVRLNDEPVGGWQFSGTKVGGFTGAPFVWTNGYIVFLQAVTGKLTIEGRRRPRTQSQFAEGRGMAARDTNTVLAMHEATLRELHQRLKRTVALPASVNVDISELVSQIQRISEISDQIVDVASIKTEVVYVANNLTIITAGIADALAARDEARGYAADSLLHSETSAAFATEARFYAEGVAAIIYDFGTFDDETSPEEDDWGVME